MGHSSERNCWGWVLGPNTAVCHVTSGTRAYIHFWLIWIHLFWCQHFYFNQLFSFRCTGPSPMTYLLNTTLLNLISDSLLPRQSKPKFHVSFWMAYLRPLSDSILDGSTCRTSGQVAPAVHRLVYTLPITLTPSVSPRTADWGTEYSGDVGNRNLSLYFWS